MKFQETLWIAPFLCFIFGYSIIYVILPQKTITTPGLIGKNLVEAARLLSEKNLNLRIIDQKEDNELHDGTIISQIPAGDQPAKIHQTVFCVISLRPKHNKTPDVIGKNISLIEEFLNQQKIKYSIYYMPNFLATDICFDQLPTPNTLLKNTIISLFISSGQHKPIVFPNLKTKLLPEVIDFLSLHQLYPMIHHEQMIDTLHQCRSCYVIDQKPPAGSIVDLSKPINIQLSVGSN